MSNVRDGDPFLPRAWVLLAVLAAFAGCRDATGPMSEGTLASTQMARVAPPRAPDKRATDEADGDSSAVISTHILTQDPGAPPLETYQASFWVYKDKATDVTVNYQPSAGKSPGQPFLWFDVPRGALQAGGAGRRLARRDSVYVTLTIDPVKFLVDFQPSGVLFSKRQPATLVLWDENANPDLNGDGVVGDADRVLEQQLLIVYRTTDRAHWHHLRSMKGWSSPFVWAALEHFSQYAVSF